MRNIIFSFLLILVTFGLTQTTVLAFEPQGTVVAGTDGGGSGGRCNWDNLKNSIQRTESLGSGGYLAVGPETKYGYPLGKYQFIADTQNRIARQFPSCNAERCNNKNPYCGGSRASCSGQPLLQEACHGVQECLMDGLMQVNLESIRSKSSCQELLKDGGRKVTGVREGKGTTSCKVTESGLVAAFHLGGTDECDDILRNGKGDCDNLGTCTTAYVCEHGGLPIPSNCTPGDYGFTGEVDEYTVSPTLTYTQLQFAIGSGDNIYTGFDSLKDLWVRSLQQMTAQIVTTMMQQVQIIGTFFDAKHQLETQRLIQQKAAIAHQKYQPSEQMCTFGTFVRTLSQSERSAALAQTTLARSMIDRALKYGDAATSELSYDEDTIENSYLSSFCMAQDNAGQNLTICTGDKDPAMANADINYTRTVSSALTIDTDIIDGEIHPEQETVFAMLDNLFMHNSFPQVRPTETELSRFVEAYLEMRSLTAMRSVAQNSLAYIIAEKSSVTTNEANIAPFLKSMLLEMGIEEDVINEMIDENPSHYAQMEFLTRKIYYHPEFVSNLYDKPENVRRMVAAMTAIKSMQDWQITEAIKRREMLTSILLELKIRDKQDELEAKDIQRIFNPRQVNDILNSIGQ